MDQLLQEIENLEVQLDLFIHQRDSAENEASVIAFETEIEIVRGKIESKKAQIEQMKQKESEIVATVQSSDSSFSISCGGYTADFRELAAGEDEYQMLSITTQLYLSQIETEHEISLRAIEESYGSEKRAAAERNTALEDELDQTRKDLSDVRTKLQAATDAITDIEIERDSAVKEAEILRKQLEEMRQQIADKPKTITNVDGGDALSEIKARIEAKKIPVYNVRPGDNRTSFYIACLASTGEEIEIRPYYELKSKYREVNENEVLQFRETISETEKAQLESSASIEPVTAPNMSQFQTEVSDAEVPEHVLHGESATEDAGQAQPTLEDRVAALEAAVFGQAKVAA